MQIMKKIIVSFVAALSVFAGAAFASEGGALAWDKAPDRTNNLPALQNGAKIFVNYCVGCHSAAYMRYTRLTDIGLTPDQIKDNLLFPTEKIGETMKAAIDPHQAKEWFGGNPPDLTVIARSRAGHGGTGADYLYTFLRTFYRDETKATGWNNLAYPNVAMPNPLWQLQGNRHPLFDEVESHGHKTEAFKGWEQRVPGTMNSAQFDDSIGDLVGYLQWMAEPAQNTRVRVGVWVLIFLGVLTVFAWNLNNAFWKDVK